MDTKRQSDRASQGSSEVATQSITQHAEYLRAELVALKAQLAAANATNARWMAATGCATPEEAQQQVVDLKSLISHMRRSVGE